MITKKVATGAAALAAAGTIVAGGAAISNASSETGGSAAGYGGYGQKAPEGAGGDRQGDRQQGQGRHEHTDVTGSEKTKVTDAVKAKDSAVTVQSVRKDPDGSYDVLGTKGGEQVMVEVSADLKTAFITEADRLVSVDLQTQQVTQIVGSLVDPWYMTWAADDQTAA